MTECEKLIVNGVLKEEFLQPEVRCEYYISTEMKKLWALQIDLVKKIESICKKYGLTYFLVGGVYRCCTAQRVYSLG